MDYTQYLANETWKCEPSPTGAHHWILGSLGLGCCIHCEEVRQFDPTAASPKKYYDGRRYVHQTGMTLMTKDPGGHHYVATRDY